MLDAVYGDTVEERSIVAIRPRPALQPLFEMLLPERGLVSSLSTRRTWRRQISLRPMGKRLTRFRVRGGGGGGSNYTVDTHSLCFWPPEL